MFSKHVFTGLPVCSRKLVCRPVACFSCLPQSGEMDGEPTTGIRIDFAAEVGLEREGAEVALSDGVFADPERAMQSFWIERGDTGVPAMVFQSQHPLVGARGVDGYREMLRQISRATT